MQYLGSEQFTFWYDSGVYGSIESTDPSRVLKHNCIASGMDPTQKMFLVTSTNKHTKQYVQTSKNSETRISNDTEIIFTKQNGCAFTVYPSYLFRTQYMNTSTKLLYMHEHPQYTMYICVVCCLFFAAKSTSIIFFQHNREIALDSVYTVYSDGALGIEPLSSNDMTFTCMLQLSFFRSLPFNHLNDCIHTIIQMIKR